jgi:hypothetical protein
MILTIMAGYSTDKTVPFDDACVCISQLLPIKDKLIYLVVSATLGRFVMPLIQLQMYPAHLYIYRDCDNEESLDLRKDYPRIREDASSIDHLTKKVKEDINSIMGRL